MTNCLESEKAIAFLVRSIGRVRQMRMTTSRKMEECACTCTLALCMSCASVLIRRLTQLTKQKRSRQGQAATPAQG